MSKQTDTSKTFNFVSKSTMNMLKGLSPTMLRLGGPSTERMKFMPEKITSDNFTVTVSQWRRLNQFIEDVNMNLIVCLNSKDRVHGVWESRDAVELIYASENNGYKLGWELGYESENLQQEGVTGSQLGRDVARLKNILGDFTMYSDSPIIGPDMKSLSTPEEVRFLREYLEESADFLTAITWHPQFTSSHAEDEDVSNKFLGIIHGMENLIWNRSNGLRSPIQPPPKKPIWLAESKSDEYTGNFSDSLTWMKRLGAAARLGFPVIMKTLTATSLTTPTPDYWVSLLYKTLVGSAVMEVKYLAGNNRSTLQVFSHCAQTGTHEHEHDSVLAPGLHYMQGAVVLYGLNLDREETRLTVRGNVKEEAVHKYVLTAAQPNHHEMEASDEDQLENRKRSSPAKTLLNGQQLSLLPSGELPTISPVKERPSRTLSFNIPGRSVFFFVMPDMKLKTCMSFTNIQGSIEKVNAIERGQNLKGSILGATRNNVPANVPKFNFSPDKTTNLETKLHVDVYSDESLKSSPGIGLKGRLTDGRLNRGLVGLPRPRTALALDSSKPKIIEKGNILYNQIPTTNQKPDEQTKKTIEFEEEEATNGMQPFNDHEQAKSNTRFVMFSDDDWMSDFTHAKESVEVARKAIEAFDEAKLRDSKSPQNSFEEQIMNQKMSPSRQKIYDALAAAISEKENLSRMEKDSGTRNAEIDLNEGDNVEKVYNRERRDNMVQELASQDTEETPVTSSDILKQKNYDEKNKTRSTSSNIMTLVRSNNIVKNSSEERNQTYEQENSLQIPLKNSSFKNIEGQINLIDQITTPLSKENSSVITENPADLGNIELGEMVLKGNSQEESACFGQIESDLKVVTEDNAQNGDNDEVLKQKAERELNNYFEGISNGEVTLDGIDASDESGVSVENEDVKDLQPHSISLNNVNDKSCIIAYNKSTNGSKDVIEEQDLRSESLEFDNDGNFEESYEKQSIKENDKLQGTNLSDDALLSENEERAERGRREMFGSPFNYYDSRYNNPNQLTLREIKQLIDELAARKRELNNVMFNRQRKTPENNLKIKNFKESETGHTEVEDGLSAGPMRITIKDSVERTETSPIDDYKIDLINNDFSNIHYTIDEDGNRFEQTNRLYRQPQTDSENPGVIESSSNNSFDREMSQADSLNQDSEVGTSLISKPAIESSPADQLMNKGNVVLEDREPEKLETIISPSPTIVEESNNERSDDQILGKSPDSMNGDIHLTEVKGAPEIPTTYSKVVTVVTRDDKNVKLTKEKEVGSVKASKEKTVSSISSPKISAAQLRMERLEALRNRILESRRKIAKANLVSATAKPPQVINKISTEVSDTNAAPAPDVGENAPSGYLEEGAPTCKASRSAPYVEGIENWIDKIERDSQEIVRELPEDQKLLDTQNRSSTLGKFNAEEETLQHEKSKKIGSTKSNRPIMSIDGMREKQNGAQIISNKQGLGVLPFEEMNSPFIIIPTSYAIMPIKPKGSRAVKNTRGYRSHPLDGNLNIGDQLGDPPVIMQEGSSQDFRADSSLEENYAPQFRAGAGDIIPNSFPLTVADPDLTVSFMKNYGREKRSPDETVGSNDQTLNRGLLNLKGLNREFEGLRKNLQISENSKLKSLTPRISLAEIRSRALARITTLRESLNSSRLKTPIKSRETRAISNIEGRAKGRSALALSDDLETNEIPKRRGEYINMYEPKIDDRGLLNSDEFEKRMKPYSRAIPVSSRRSMDADIGNVGRENQVNVKQYSDNDYLVERMSMTDRAVVGLKHSVEELENTAKEILDKFRTSDYSNEERKKPSLQNILQNTFRVGRPREPKRTGALAFLNPIIDLALKFMRTLGIIS